MITILTDEKIKEIRMMLIATLIENDDNRTGINQETANKHLNHQEIND